jgi:hypothetical protein
MIGTAPSASAASLMRPVRRRCLRRRLPPRRPAVLITLVMRSVKLRLYAAARRRSRRMCPCVRPLPAKAAEVRSVLVRPQRTRAESASPCACQTLQHRDLMRAACVLISMPLAACLTPLGAYCPPTPVSPKHRSPVVLYCVLMHDAATIVHTQLAHSRIYRRYLAAMSHADAAWTPPATCPLSSSDHDNGCRATGWGSEAVCCGNGCVPAGCKNAVYTNNTLIYDDQAHGCGNVVSSLADGVLCCKTG